MPSAAFRQETSKRVWVLAGDLWRLPLACPICMRHPRVLSGLGAFVSRGVASSSRLDVGLKYK